MAPGLGDIPDFDVEDSVLQSLKSRELRSAEVDTAASQGSPSLIRHFLASTAVTVVGLSMPSHARAMDPDGTAGTGARIFERGLDEQQRIAEAPPSRGEQLEERKRQIEQARQDREARRQMEKQPTSEVTTHPHAPDPTPPAESTATTTSDASKPTLSSLDFLQPAGGAIGQPLDAVRADLLVKGFREVTRYIYTADFDQATVRLRFDVKHLPSQTSRPHQLVKKVTYELESMELDESPRDLVERVTKDAGAEPSCDILSDEVALCFWNEVPRASLVESLYLQFGPERVRTNRVAGRGHGLKLSLVGIESLQ